MISLSTLGCKCLLTPNFHVLLAVCKVLPTISTSLIKLIHDWGIKAMTDAQQ